MTLKEWQRQYLEIRKKFGYSEDLDYESAVILDSIIKRPVALEKIKKIIHGKTVFIIGSGPSLSSNISKLEKFKKNPMIVADGAVVAMIQNDMVPQIVVTDLDGDQKALRDLSKTRTIFVVHAHGDNMEKLPFAENFKNCLGTTQTSQVGKIRNFGGFTDGDRCVFLARHFGAKNIILIGMDFGKKIGKYSLTKNSERSIKLKKLETGKKLLEWLAGKNQRGLYTTSVPIKGFKKISFRQIQDDIIT